MRLPIPALRLTAWLTLGCHVLVAGGLPLPLAPCPSTDGPGSAGTAAKDRSRPFPCLDKPCGCASAEQCFASCCCHTPAERLAWATAHGVEPAVLAALERRVAAESTPSADCRAASAGEPACCANADAGAPDLDGPDVCRDYRSLAAEPRGAAADDGPPAPRVVILRDALACGGIVTAWMACGLALPPPPPTTAPTHDARVGFLPLLDVVVPSVSADVATPPPRAA